MKSATTATAIKTDVSGAVSFPPWLSKTLIGLFMAAAFTATWGGIHLGGIQTADIFLLFAYLLIGPMVVLGNLRFVIPWWVWAPTLALFACFAALTYGPIPDAYFTLRYEYMSALTGTSGGVKSAFWIIALLFVPVAVIACTSLDSRAPKWTLAAFLAGAAVSSFIALTDLTNLTHVSRDLGFHFDNHRQTGLTDHPNTLGLVCVIASPFAVHFFSQSRRRWLPFIALLLLCGGVAASGSRGAQIVFPVTICVAILISPHKKRVGGVLAATLTVGIVGGLTVLMQFVPGLFDRLLRFEEGGSVVNSNAERSSFHAQALDDFKNYPIFGIGIDHINEAHNIYLQIISAGGSVLAAGMLIFWFGALRSCWLAKRAGEALGAYLALSIFAWLAIDVLENHLTDRFLYYTVGCAAALMAGTQAGWSPIRQTAPGLELPAAKLARL